MFILAESFGGYCSLVDHPALMTHKYASAEERQRIGVSDTLVSHCVRSDLTAILLASAGSSLSGPGGYGRPSQ